MVVALADGGVTVEVTETEEVGEGVAVQVGGAGTTAAVRGWRLTGSGSVMASGRRTTALNAECAMATVGSGGETMRPLGGDVDCSAPVRVSEGRWSDEGGASFTADSGEMTRETGVPVAAGGLRAMLMQRLLVGLPSGCTDPSVCI